MILKSVEIEGFRGIQKMTLELHPRLNVLIGGNGCGKTTVLDAIGSGIDRILTYNYNKNLLFYGSNPKPEDFWSEEMPLNKNDINKNNKSNICFKLKTIDDISILDDEIKNIKTLNGDMFLIFRYYTTNRIIPKKLDQMPLISKRNGYRSDAWLGVTSSGQSFDFFQEWFKDQSIAESLEHTKRRSFDYQIPTLQAVRAAVRSMIPGCQNIWLAGTPPEIMVQLEDEPELSLRELSDGYRTLLALVADLAQRMVIGNPHLGLESEAIVLIDEIDLHLHPRWQQTVLSSLLQTFPNAQFIVTTHAAPIIATVQPESLICLDRGPDGIHQIPSGPSYGAMPDRIMEDIMGVATARPPDVAQKLTDYFALIEDGRGESEEALIIRRWLEDNFRTRDPELVRADIAIRRRRLQARPA